LCRCDPHGQWDASGALGLNFLLQMRYVILPQALRIAVPPTVGFLTQLVKATALRPSSVSTN